MKIRQIQIDLAFSVEIFVGFGAIFNRKKANEINKQRQYKHAVRSNDMVVNRN